MGAYTARFCFGRRFHRIGCVNFDNFGNDRCNRLILAQFCQYRLEHRRIDPRKAALRLRQRSGTVSLVVSLTESNLEYGVRKAVNLIHEVFVSFLRDPLYFSYMVQYFGLDPDT